MPDANLIDIKPIAINIKFMQRGLWSKAYTYKSGIVYMPDDVVIVPMRSFYAIGKVISYNKNHDFNPDVDYKWVLRKVDFAKD